MHRLQLRISVLVAIFVAAAAFGFFCSSEHGREILREELVTQLSGLMDSPVRIERARFRFGLGSGLRIEGQNLSTYADAGGPQLLVERAVARLDVFSLLLGRFRLRGLLLEGAHLRVVRPIEGPWTPKPIAEVVEAGASTSPELEHRIRSLRAFEMVARFFLERGLLASRLSLRRGQISFVDERVRPNSAPLVLHLADMDGSLAHSWMSGETELSLRASLLGASGRRTILEAQGRQLGDGSIHLALAARALSLEVLRPYAQAVIPDARLAGSLSGVVSVDSQTHQHGVIEFDWILEDLDAALRLREDPIPIESPRVGLVAALELHPGRVRVSRFEMEGSGLHLSVSGDLERPVRESSDASLAASVGGVGLRELEAMVSALPRSDRQAIDALMDRVVSGEIVRVGGEGSARLSTWQRLVAGELVALPDGFVLSAEVSGVVVGTSEIDELTDLAARVAWTGDRIELEEARALWNGEPLPVLSASIDGVSHLLSAPEAQTRLRVEAARLPGLRTAWEFLGVGSDSEEGSVLALPSVRVHLREIHHPALRWPLRDARLRLEPMDAGMRLTIDEGAWAGAAISGEGRWVPEPTPVLHLELRVEAPHANQSPPSDQLANWMDGSFEVAGMDTASVPYESLQGEFSITGSRLVVAPMTARLLPSGRFRAGGEIDLADPVELPLQLRFEIEDGDVATLTHAVGFPKDFAQGRGEVSGRLDGTAIRDVPLLSTLVGRIEVAAGPGRVHRSVPVITAVANLSEGLVTQDVVRFERIEAAIDFDHGRLSTKRLALDGPMRLIAKGSFDPSKDEEALDITVGIFLMRRFERVLGSLPLIRHFTDSGKGLFGVYFALNGTWAEPRIKTLPARTLTEGTGIPRIVEAPLKMLRGLETLLGGDGEPDDESQSPSPLSRKGARRPTPGDDIDGAGSAVPPAQFAP